MSEKSENPPAFPRAASVDPLYNGQVGMTLRDYFAAKIAQGFLAFDSDYTPDDLASAAYIYSDAMLKARG